jgi:hypothetical protein
MKAILKTIIGHGTKSQSVRQQQQQQQQQKHNVRMSII